MIWSVITVVVCALILDCHSEISNVVVDFSHNQVAKADFDKVKNDDIAVIIHKASEGTGYVDPDFSQMRVVAEKEGLLWGAYHFANKGDPAGQADNFLKAVGNTEGVLLVLSLEENQGNEMSVEEAEEYVQRIVEKTGRYPLIFGVADYLEQYDTPPLSNCSLWVGSHTSDSLPLVPSYRNSWVLWQYTDGQSGGFPRSVDGIGACSRSKFNGSVEQLKSSWPKL